MFETEVMFTRLSPTFYSSKIINSSERVLAQGWSQDFSSGRPKDEKKKKKKKSLYEALNKI